MQSMKRQTRSDSGESVRQEFDIDGTWRAEFEFVPSGTTWVIRQVRVLPAEGADVGAGISSTVLHGVPFTSARRWINFYENLEELARQAEPKADEIRRTIEREWRQRSAWPDERYAHISSVYVERLEAGSRSPVADVAKRFHAYATSQVRDAIRTARERGILTETAQGRAGGRLTAYGESLLSEKRR